MAVQLDPEHSSAHLNLGVIFHLEVSNDPVSGLWIM